METRTDEKKEKTGTVKQAMKTERMRVRLEVLCWERQSRSGGGGGGSSSSSSSSVVVVGGSRC